MDGDDVQPLRIGRVLSQILDDGDGSPRASFDRDQTRPEGEGRASAGGGRRGGGGPGRGGGWHGRGGRRRTRASYPRNLCRLGIDQLVGLLLTIHGLTDEVRLRIVYIYWRQIVGARVGANTVPDSISDGVLTVYVRSSVWMHEVRFFREAMVEQINNWIIERRRWLGSDAFVSSIRFVLGSPREPLVDPDQLHDLIQSTRDRRPPPDRQPPEGGASGQARDAIREASSCIQDPELRRIIEDVRTRWDR